MNNQQRQSAAKYLYDISKVIAILAVISNILGEKASISNLIFGFAAVIIFYIFAFTFETGIKDD